MNKSFQEIFSGNFWTTSYIKWNSLCSANFDNYPHRGTRHCLWTFRCLDIDIGFARSGFHFNIKAAAPQVFYKGSWNFDIILALQGLNVVQKLFIGNPYCFIFYSRYLIVRLYPLSQFLSYINHNTYLFSLRYDFSVNSMKKDFILHKTP